MKRLHSWLFGLGFVAAALLFLRGKQKQKPLYTAMVSVLDHSGMPHHEFEHMLADLLRKQGAEVFEAHHHGGRDHSVDLHFAVEIDVTPRARLAVMKVVPLIPPSAVRLRVLDALNGNVYAKVFLVSTLQQKGGLHRFAEKVAEHLVVNRIDGELIIEFRGDDLEKVLAPPTIEAEEVS